MATVLGIDQEQLFQALKVALPIPASTYPFVYFLIGAVVALIAVQTSQQYRPAFVPIIGAPLLISLTLAPTAFHGFTWCYNWGLFMVIFFLWTVFRLLIEQQAVDVGLKWSSTATMNYWIGAYKVLSDRQNPKQLPGTRVGPNVSRSYYFFRQLAGIAVVGGLLYITPLYIFPGFFEPLNPEEFAPSREFYVRRLFFPTDDPITPRETGMRALFSLVAGWETALQLMQCHTLAALFWVCILQVDEPKDWPPFFGPLSAMTSLQTFWGRFWHRVVVRSYTGFAGVVSQKVLRLAPRSPADRFVIHALTFSISGLVHLAVSWGFGQECEKWRDYAWYAAQFPAILLETPILMGVGSLTSKLLQDSGFEKGSQIEALGVERVQAVVGLSYTFLWFFWSVPRWWYPKFVCMPGVLD